MIELTLPFPTYTNLNLPLRGTLALYLCPVLGSAGLILLDLPAPIINSGKGIIWRFYDLPFQAPNSSKQPLVCKLLSGEA